MRGTVNNRETGAFRHIAGHPARAAAAIVAAIAMLIAPIAPSFAKSRRHHQHGVHAARHHAHHHRSARHRHHRKRHAVRHATNKRPAPTRAAILIDADTGEVLSEKNADKHAYPASLTKMMTLYLTFKALNEHRLKLGQRLPVSAHAASQEPTKLWLKSGESVKVKNLILGIVTRSANDAAVVLAEGIAGSESAFAKRMTATAKRLGMTDTVFRNASGLPDPKQHTTARDIARLALALYHDFPREYGYFATQEFEFRGKTITGHNHLLGTYEGADGLKTGYIRASGFNLAASAERNGHRLIGVVLGGRTAKRRDRHMVALLDRGFAELGSAQTAIAAADRVLKPKGSNHPSGKLARLARYLSTAAEAAEIDRPKIRSAVHRRPAAARASCGIQLGAFHARKAARKLARTAVRLPVAEGKRLRVVKPARRKKHGFYRVQLLGFTHKGASRACAALKDKKQPCMVVHQPR